jgi:hypothetical protein
MPEPAVKVVVSREVAGELVDGLRRGKWLADLPGEHGTHIKLRPLGWGQTGGSPCRSWFEVFTETHYYSRSLEVEDCLTLADRLTDAGRFSLYIDGIVLATREKTAEPVVVGVMRTTA